MYVKHVSCTTCHACYACCCGCVLVETRLGLNSAHSWGVLKYAIEKCPVQSPLTYELHIGMQMMMNANDWLSYLHWMNICKWRGIEHYVRHRCKTAPMSHSRHAQHTFTHKRVISHNTCSIVKVEVHRILLKNNPESKSQPMGKGGWPAKGSQGKHQC